MTERDYNRTLDRVSEYAEARGLKLTTLSLYISGNAFMLRRTRERIAQLDRDMERIEAYMAENPVEAVA